MNPQDRLAERYVLDGDLTAEEAQRLADTLRRGGDEGERLREEMAFTCLLGQALADDSDEAFLRAVEERLDGKPSALLRAVDRSLATRSARRHASRRQPRPRWSAWPALAAAALLLLGIGFFALKPPAAPAAANAIASLRPEPGAEVELRRDGRSATGDAVQPGDVIIVHRGSAALAFPDATILALADRAELAIEDGPAKRLRLTRGTLDADVAHQPIGRPLTVRTPHALVTVVGTRLRIAVDAATVVSVRQGLVRVADLAGGTAADLAAGASTRIAAPTEGARAAEPAPPLPRPGKGVVVADPRHRTELVRVTDTADDVPGGSGFLVAHRAARQAFNANGSRFLLYGADGWFHLYDAATFRHLDTLTGVHCDSEPQWDAADADLLYYLPDRGGLEIRSRRIASGADRVAADLRGRLPWADAAHVWTKGHGSPSLDRRYWHLLVEDAQRRTLGSIVWDLRDGILAASRPQPAGDAPSGTGTAPSGGRVVIYGGTVDGVRGTWSFSSALSGPVLLQNGVEEADLGRDAAGNDVLVGVNYDGDPTLPAGHLFMADLRSGRRTPLLPLYAEGGASAVHISAQASGKPGWAVVATYAETGHPWYARKILAVELRADPRIVVLAHDRWAPPRGGNPDDAYWATPQATPDRTLDRILFNSTWGGGRSDQLDAYLVRVLPGLLPAARTDAP